MNELTFEGVAVAAPKGATVLAALEAAGVAIESSCRAGVCQSCLVQSLDGPPPKAAQAGLSKALVLDDYFMACVCVPDGPLNIGRAGGVRQRVDAVVRSLDWLSATVAKLRLEPAAPFAFLPGQFLTLTDTATGVARSYSIAGSDDGLIELHVRILPGGAMSDLVSGEFAPGRPVSIAGPSGGCVYQGLDPDRRIVLAATGTGLAPLWAILNDALAHGHRGPIRLYHGALDRAGLYLVETLEALQSDRADFRYIPCVRDHTDPANADLVQMVAEAEKAVADTSYFFCGDEGIVKRLKKAVFLAGAKLDDIHADPFVPAQTGLAA